MTERRLDERLRRTPVPDADGAEERAWLLVRAAYQGRAAIRPKAPARRLALVLAASLAIVALALTPAGAKVVDAVREVVGIDESETRPALGPLPAAGELLVESPDGIWIVRDDGSKRLLGDYADATWSPRGLFVVAAAGRQLVAVDPLGDVRWTVSAPARVRDPRWSPSGFRIAYRSDGDLRVVAGDGTGDRVVAREVAPVAPAWRATSDAKLEAASGSAGTEQVGYVDGSGYPRLVDADTGTDRRGIPRTPRRTFVPAEHGVIEEIAWSAAGETFVARSEDALVTDRIDGGGFFAYVASGRATIGEFALAPAGDRVAFLERRAGQSRIQIVDLGSGDESIRGPIFAGPGTVEGLTWSPDGGWLLAGWREADQWLFIRAERPRRLVAIDGVARQFDPGDTGRGGFPRASGWVSPER